MPIRIKATFDSRELAALQSRRIEKALQRIVKRANATALRDMASESSKRVRNRKRLKVRDVKPALKKIDGRVRGSGIGSTSVAIGVRGDPIPLINYPNTWSRRRRGVRVAIDRGKPAKILAGTFKATMKFGPGIFIRKTRARGPVKGLLGPRPVDVLLKDGEALGVAMRGLRSFEATVARLFRAELDKG